MTKKVSSATLCVQEVYYHVTLKAYRLFSTININQKIMPNVLTIVDLKTCFSRQLMFNSLNANCLYTCTCTYMRELSAAPSHYSSVLCVMLC